MLEKIDNRKISQKVYQSLKDEIVRGEWKPGEKIPSEPQLSKQLGVSRSTIRQAIRRLSDYGLIETRNGAGSFVREDSSIFYMRSVVPSSFVKREDIEEILEFCTVFENDVAALAACRVTPEELDELQSIQEKIEQGENMAENDLRFHQKIAEITHNSIIIKVYSVLNGLLKAAMEEMYRILGPEGGISYHRALIEALREHDSGTARRVMEEHAANRSESFHRLAGEKAENTEMV